MRNKKLGFLALLFAAVFTVGIGYAALQDSFFINGEFQGVTDNSNLKVQYDTQNIEINKNGVDTANVVFEVSTTIDTTATLTITGLTTAGQSVIVRVPVKNNSTGAVGTELDALLSSPSVTSTDEEMGENGHFNVSASWVEEEGEDLKLEAARTGVDAESRVLEITVTLLKTITATNPELHRFEVTFTATTD